MRGSGLLVAKQESATQPYPDQDIPFRPADLGQHRGCCSTIGQDNGISIVLIEAHVGVVQKAPHPRMAPQISLRRPPPSTSYRPTGDLGNLLRKMAYDKLLQQCFQEGWSRFVLINHAEFPQSHGVHFAKGGLRFRLRSKSNFKELSAPIFSGATSSWSVASNTFGRPARQTIGERSCS